MALLGGLNRLGFWDMVLSDQDGRSRMFEAGARALRIPHVSQRAVLLVFVTALVLYMNRRVLPRELAPSAISCWMTVAAAAFFAAFAALYVVQVTGGEP